jgi:Na+/melibiose symporter-like transporter
LNIRTTSVGSVFTPYLVALFVPVNMYGSATGFISTAGLIIAMLVQPAAGLLSDRSTSRFGRRRPYIFFGSLFDLVFLAAIALSGNFWMLLVATLLIQFSANVSHGPLQGLIPDLVPEEQRGRSSAVKAVMELIPIVLVGFTIAQLVGSGHFIWAVIVTGAALLVTMLLTMVLVKEEPLKTKPATSFKIPMLRVLGILAGIAIGAVAGLIGGGAVGGLAGLIAWPFVGKAAALALMVGLGGLVAMVVAVVVGVWAGVAMTLGRKNTTYHISLFFRTLGIFAGIIVGAIVGLLAVGLVYWIIQILGVSIFWILPIALSVVGIGIFIAVVVGVKVGRVTTLDRDNVRELAPFTWWIVNRLLFLAAATSFQGFLPFFLMFAFKIDAEQAASMNGTLMTVIGLAIILFAFAGGWIADLLGKRRTVAIGGVVAAVGGVLVLGTAWVPSIAIIYIAGMFIGLGTGLFMTANWALGTDLVPAEEAGRYLGISNLAGAGAGMIGKGIGGPVIDSLNVFHPGLGYFAIFASYAVLFALSAVSLRWVRKVKR